MKREAGLKKAIRHIRYCIAFLFFLVFFMILQLQLMPSFGSKINKLKREMNRRDIVIHELNMQIKELNGHVHERSEQNKVIFRQREPIIVPPIVEDSPAELEAKRQESWKELGLTNKAIRKKFSDYIESIKGQGGRQ